MWLRVGYYYLFPYFTFYLIKVDYPPGSHIPIWERGKLPDSFRLTWSFCPKSVIDRYGVWNCAYLDLRPYAVWRRTPILYRAIGVIFGKKGASDTSFIHFDTCYRKRYHYWHGWKFCSSIYQFVPQWWHIGVNTFYYYRYKGDPKFDFPVARRVPSIPPIRYLPKTFPLEIKGLNYFGVPARTWSGSGYGYRTYVEMFFDGLPIEKIRYRWTSDDGVETYIKSPQGNMGWAGWGWDDNWGIKSGWTVRNINRKVNSIIFKDGGTPDTIFYLYVTIKPLGVRIY
jgi:hypothetical protein